jgi:hypothetical protein
VVNNNLGAEIFIWTNPFFFLKTTMGISILEGVILQVAFTGLVTYRAIKGMI